MENKFCKTIDTIREIAPHFEDTVKRYFQVQVHSRMKRMKSLDLESLFLLQENLNNLTLSNIKLLNFPKFKLNSISLNPQNLCLETNIELGDLVIETNYESSANNSSTLLSFTLNNVLANGNIGLLYVGDSFVPTNYDLEYKIEQVTYELNKTVAEIDALPVEDLKTLIEDQFALKWTQTLNHLLNLCMAEAVVEISISEFFEAVENLKQFYDHKISCAKSVTDAFLTALQSKCDNAESIKSLPLETKCFMTDEICASFKLCDGEIKQFVSFDHGKDFSMIENGNQVIVYGNLISNIFKQIPLNFELKKNEIHLHKKVMLNVDQVIAFLKLIVTQDSEGLIRRDIKVFRIMKISNPFIDVENLDDEADETVTGAVDSQAFYEKLQRWVVENVRFTLQKKLDEIAKLQI